MIAAKTDSQDRKLEAKLDALSQRLINTIQQLQPQTAATKGGKAARNAAVLPQGGEAAIKHVCQRSRIPIQQPLRSLPLRLKEKRWRPEGNRPANLTAPATCMPSPIAYQASRS